MMSEDAETDLLIKEATELARQMDVFILKLKRKPIKNKPFTKPTTTKQKLAFGKRY